MSPRIPALAVSSAVAIALAALIPAHARAAATEWRLPDLEQEAPSGLVLTSGAFGRHADRYYLGFRSAVRNVGLGPLVIHGRRRSRRTPTMAATQIIQGDTVATRRVLGVGRMRYVVSPGHRHWHLLTFDRYTLRRIGGGHVQRRGRKTGFCLGDRYRTLAPLAAPASPAPAFTSNCGLGQPGRLTMGEGISVGYGDDYAANLEGQLIALSGLPSGRYVLAHDVNPGHGLRELRYDNNGASLLLSLRWLRGMPYVRVLAACDRSVSCSGHNASASRHMIARRDAEPVALATAWQFYCHAGTANTTALSR
jgi:hypothetical protein